MTLMAMTGMRQKRRTMARRGEASSKAGQLSEDAGVGGAGTGCGSSLTSLLVTETSTAGIVMIRLVDRNQRYG